METVQSLSDLRLSEEDTESYKFFTEMITGKDSMFFQSPKIQKT
jgi:hypothetical protein